MKSYYNNSVFCSTCSLFQSGHAYKIASKCYNNNWTLLQTNIKNVGKKFKDADG